MVKDEVLVKKVLEGDTSGFTVLVKRYQDRLYSFLLKITYSKEDAEEILQDVFLRAYKYLYRYNEKWSFSTWIYKITANTYKFVYKKRKKYYEKITFERIPEELYNLQDCPEVVYENKEMYKEFLKMLGCLNEKQKIAVLLRHTNEFSYKEIGKILGISEYAAKMRVKRGREILRQKYNKKRGDYIR